MTRCGILISALAFGLTPVFASACEGVADGAPTAWVDSMALATQAVKCDPVDRSCRWSFALGDDVSRSLFDGLVKKMHSCPNFEKSVQDIGVNHPDFYDAWAIQLGKHGFTVSIKDKSALKQTFVVLRIMSEMRPN